MRLQGAIAALGASAALLLASRGGQEVLQLGRFATGLDGAGLPLTVPSIDPASVTWHGPSGHLFVVDPEINEVPEAFAIVTANVFEVSAAGDILHGAWDLTALGNLEPTGIAWSPADDSFYMTDDNARTVTRYTFSPASGFAVQDVVSTSVTAGSYDPEGVDVDPRSGLIYVVDGADALVSVYACASTRPGFRLVEVLVLRALNPPSRVPRDPEGIAVDPSSGHLFLVSNVDDAVFEFTQRGLFVAVHQLGRLAPAARAPQGLCFAPASGADIDAPGLRLFIADGGVDNDEDPRERDGAVYEIAVGGPPAPDAPVAHVARREGAPAVADLAVPPVLPGTLPTSR